MVRVCVFCVCVCVCMRACVCMHACVCVDEMNLKYALHWRMHYTGISTYQFIPYYASIIHKHMHTCILKTFEDSEPMGLKVDITESSTGPVAILLAMPAEVSLPVVWPVKERVPLVHWPFYWPWTIRAVAIPNPVNRFLFIFYVFYSLLFIGAVAMWTVFFFFMRAVAVLNLVNRVFSLFLFPFSPPPRQWEFQALWTAFLFIKFFYKSVFLLFFAL